MKLLKKHEYLVIQDFLKGKKDLLKDLTDESDYEYRDDFDHLDINEYSYVFEEGYKYSVQNNDVNFDVLGGREFASSKSDRRNNSLHSF